MMLNNEQKPSKVVVYSGHCEIVGGDGKYIIDIVNNIPRDHFDISFYTDRNPVFEERRKQWMNTSKSVTYLDTHPVIFDKTPVDHLVDWAHTSQDSKTRALLAGAFDMRLAGFPVSKWVRGGYKFCTAQRKRSTRHNVKIFREVFLRETGAKVFHFNNGGYPGKDAGITALSVAKSMGLKTMMTVHNEPMPVGPFGHKIDKAVAENCDLVIAASDNVRNKLVELRNLPEDKLIVRYCGLCDVRKPGLDEIRALKKSLGVENMSPLLLICGNFDEYRKGHPVLIRAMAAAGDSLRDAGLLIAGPGSSAQREMLERLADSLGLSNRIRFLGFRQDVELLNAAADIAVVPSRGVEAIPYTVTEAARAGTPIIASDIGGCPYAVRDGKTGLLVPPNDHLALAAALEKLGRDPDLRAEMSKNSREFFLDRFLLEKELRYIEKLWGRE